MIEVRFLVGAKRKAWYTIVMATHRRKIFEQKLTSLDKFSDWITAFTGSWTFIALHVIWFIVWFSFGLDIDHLTLVLSVEAILLATFILMSGNREQRRNNIRDDADFEADVKAEQDIEDMKRTLERIEQKLK